MECIFAVYLACISFVYYLFNAVHLLTFPTEVGDMLLRPLLLLYGDTRTALNH